jgi:hypothetical protein
MTTNGARNAFLRSYDIPTILLRYPRLMHAMRRIAALSRIEAAGCIRDLKAGHRWSNRTVNLYGGTRRLANDAWHGRRASGPTVN